MFVTWTFNLHGVRNRSSEQDSPSATYPPLILRGFTAEKNTNRRFLSALASLTALLLFLPSTFCTIPTPVPLVRHLLRLDIATLHSSHITMKRRGTPSGGQLPPPRRQSGGSCSGRLITHNKEFLRGCIFHPCSSAWGGGCGRKGLRKNVRKNMRKNNEGANPYY